MDSIQIAEALEAVITTRSIEPAPSARGRAPSDEHVPALDGLRGIAILAVLCVHMSWLPTQTPIDRALTVVANCGWMGVDLFFVLSGYLITGILLDCREAPHFFRTFYARRALRILPLYYAFVLLFIVILPAVHRPTPALQSLLAHQGWLWAHAVNLWAARDGLSAIPYSVGVAWSLSLEEQFYFIWPFVVRFVPRAALKWVCAGCIVGAFLLRVCIAGRWPSAAYTLVPARMDALALGGLMAITVRNPGGLDRLRRFAAPVAGAALILIAALYVVRGNMRTPDWSLGTFGYAGADWLSAGLLMFAVSSRSNILSTRALRFFGRYSYSLYLFHLPMMTMLAPVEHRLYSLPLMLGSPILWMLVWMGVAIGATTLLSLVSWRVLEQPILGLKRYLPYGTPLPSFPTATFAPVVVSQTSDPLPVSP